MEGLLEKILEILNSLYDLLTNRNPDNRIWKPDDSCSPFQLFSTGGLANNCYLRFTIPNGLKGVITHIGVSSNNETQKVSDRMVILKGKGSSIGDRIPIPIHGALTDVLEMDTFESHFPGITTSVGFPQAVRILLDAGTYEVWKAGSGPVNHNFFMHGYTYSGTPK